MNIARSKMITAALALVLLMSLVVTPMQAGAQANTLVFAIASSYTYVTGATGPVGGAFTLQQFAVQNKKLVAVGQLEFSLCVIGVDPQNCLANVVQQAALPVALVTATCAQVHLETAPIDVTDPSLPGYTVHLPRLVMDFSVQPNSPAKFGQILCKISHRLNGNAPLRNLAPLLNQLLTLL